MALALHRLAQQHAHGDGRGVVGLRRGNRLLLVLPEFLLVTQGAKRHHGHVDIAVRERLADHTWVGSEINRVEVDHPHVSGAGGGDGLYRRVDTRRVLACSEGDRGIAAARDDLFHNGQANLGRAAEEQDVLCLSYCIEHDEVLSSSAGD